MHETLSIGNPVQRFATALGRKISAVRQDPVGTVRYKVHRALNRHAHRKLKDSGLMADLDEFRRGRPAEAIAPDYNDLWFLYKMVRNRRPKVIVEYGAGYSTVVLARATLENFGVDGGAQVTSFDAEHYWAEAASRSLPSGLSSVCEIRYSPLKEVKRAGVLGFEHVEKPNRMPNFVYLDGPRLTPERDVAVDLLDLEAELPPDFFLVIDGREANTRFLRKELRRRYEYRQRYFSYNHVMWLTWDPLESTCRHASLSIL